MDCEGGVTEAHNDGNGWYRTNKNGVRWGVKLRDAVNASENWPTPRHGNPGSRPNEKGGKVLAEEAKKWPTARSAIGMGMKLTENMADLRHKKYLETEVAHEQGGCGGQLNPDWVEWLMGWPIGWSSLEPIDLLFWLDWSADPADVDSDYYEYPTPSTFDTVIRDLENQKDVRDTMQLAEIARMYPEGNPTTKKWDEVKWTSPKACEIDEDPEQWEKRRLKPSAKMMGPSLTVQVKQKEWKTPNVVDATGRTYQYVGKDRKKLLCLPGQVKEHPTQGMIPRVSTNIPDRVNRLKAIGNGMCPQTAALAWNVLTKGLLN